MRIHAGRDAGHRRAGGERRSLRNAVKSLGKIRKENEAGHGQRVESHAGGGGRQMKLKALKNSLEKVREKGKGREDAGEENTGREDWATSSGVGTFSLL